MIYCNICKEFKHEKAILAFINKSKYKCLICYDSLSSIDVLLRNKENIVISKRIEHKNFHDNNNDYNENDDNTKLIVNMANLIKK